MPVNAVLSQQHAVTSCKVVLRLSNLFDCVQIQCCGRGPSFAQRGSRPVGPIRRSVQRSAVGDGN